MAALNLRNALMARVGETLKNVPLKTSYNNQDPFKIFKQKIPEKLSSDFDYSKEGGDKALFPFCVVKLSDGIQEENVSTEIITTQLIIGVKNDNPEGDGFDDVMACMSAIRADLNNNPIVNKKYLLNYPISWTTVDVDTHPYYYIALNLDFECNSISHQGGFIHEGRIPRSN